MIQQLNIGIEGRVLVHEVLRAYKRPVAAYTNLVTELAYTELLPAILGRNVNADIAIISLGTGGNFDIAGNNTGARVPPAITDTEMRQELFRAGITQINFPAPNTVEFVGLLRQQEAVSTDIDEFGLLSTDGRMFSHVIAAAAGPGDPTTPLVKPAGAIYSITWELALTRM
jgi:hypothetical protein